MNTETVHVRRFPENASQNAAWGYKARSYCGMTNVAMTYSPFSGSTKVTCKKCRKYFR